MRCEELMKQKIECVGPTDTGRDASQKMRDANVGFLPVCDNDGRVLGTVTDRDIAIRIVADDLPSGTPIERVMTKEVVACRESDDLTEALRLMRENHKSRVMVVDDDGRIRGVISLSDIARIAAGESAETLREISGREART